jgi:hypothetical protein
VSLDKYGSGMCDLDLLHLHEDTATVLGVKEHNRLSMGPNLGLSVTNHANFLLDALLDGSVDVWDLEADVMHASGGLLGKERSDGALITQGVEQLQLGVGKLTEDGGDTVLGEVLGCANLGLEELLVHLGGVEDGGGLGHSDGNVVKTAKGENCTRGGVGGECPGDAATEHFL